MTGTWGPLATAVLVGRTLLAGAGFGPVVLLGRPRLPAAATFPPPADLLDLLGGGRLRRGATLDATRPAPPEGWRGPR